MLALEEKENAEYHGENPWCRVETNKIKPQMTTSLVSNLGGIDGRQVLSPPLHLCTLKLFLSVKLRNKNKRWGTVHIGFFDYKLGCKYQSIR